MTPVNSPGVPARLVGGGAPLNEAGLAVGGDQRPTDGASFRNLLVDSLEHVNGMQTEADQAVEALFTGEDVNAAEVLTAVQKADMAFRLTMQVRNKLMDVYQQIQEIRI